jgi:hypothetical protein
MIPVIDAIAAALGGSRDQKSHTIGKRLKDRSLI